MIPLLCPVCHKPLTLDGSVYSCENRHTFDRSRYHYVNLIRSAKKIHGDNADMVKARTRFLQSDAYLPLKEELKKIVTEAAPATLLDSGCGEGYYTELCESLENCQCFGVDLSKEALKQAGRFCPHVTFAAASIFTLPLPDHSIDLIWSCFAPVAWEENHRVLTENGKLIIIGPGPHHLFGLKKVLYDNPYLNPEENIGHDQFELIDQKTVSYTLECTSAQMIQDLFTMTPYYFKTSIRDKEKLNALDHCSTEVEFVIRIYQKKNNH